MKIVFSDSAFDDLNSIKNYYISEGVPEVGESLISNLLGRIALLEKSPDMGRIVPEFQEPKIREVIESSFRIVYLREQNSVSIIRIWRSERILVLV